LIEIWTYTDGRWGAVAADEYLAMLRHMATGLLDFPRLGQVYPGRHKELRAIKAGEHRIVYCPHPGTIEVIRILHARMDPKRHLG
jgi:toxin ParE1/3/4